MSEQRRLRVTVDDAKCQGHARCIAYAPTLFTLDDYGNAHAVGDGLVPVGEEESAALAKANCPEIAIAVSEV